MRRHVRADRSTTAGCSRMQSPADQVPLMVGFVADDLGPRLRDARPSRRPRRVNARASRCISGPRDQLTASKRIYTYFFDRAIPWPAHPEFGAFHSGEIPYFFNTLSRLNRPWEPVDRRLADTVSLVHDELREEGRPERSRACRRGRRMIRRVYIDDAAGAQIGPMPLADAGATHAAARRAEEVTIRDMQSDLPAVVVSARDDRPGRPRPAAAQAAGSAEASAAKRVNPNWKAPRTPWGHPDLEGTWTTDDMRGVPMSRQPQYGDAPIPHRSGIRRTRQAAQQRPRHRRRENGHLPQRGGLARLQLHLDGDRSAGWPRPADDRQPPAPVRVRAAPSASGRGRRFRTSRSTTAASRAARSARSCRPSMATARASCRRPTPSSSPTR